MVEIRKLCDGIFVNDGDLGPDVIEHQGNSLNRFMDRFYHRGTIDALTQSEVAELCRERARHPESILPANRHVRTLFGSIILELKPSTFLEIGAGGNPILDTQVSDNHSIKNVLVDADPENSVVVFSATRPTLPFEDESVDMAAAVFVLHFHFYANQIAELYRCMSPTGIFIANVYKRDESARDALATDLHAAGFHVTKVLDPKQLCAFHEYWVMSKCQLAAEKGADRLNLLAMAQIIT